MSVNNFNMQNVICWIHHSKGFKFKNIDDMGKTLNYINFQVENSLRLGWDKKDIIVITNFPYEYLDVKTNLITEKDGICEWSAFANKMVVVNTMVKRGVINDNFWLHDCDAYQLVPFEFPSLVEGVGFTKHNLGRQKPQGGSVFYNKNSFDIVAVVSRLIKEFKINQEESFFSCLYNKAVGDKKISQYLYKYEKDVNYKKYYDLAKKYFGRYEDRMIWLNPTYNLFRVAYFSRKYKVADKPIKVCHFHTENEVCNDCFIYGKNPYNVNVVDDETRDLMIKHKILKDRSI